MARQIQLSRAKISPHPFKIEGYLQGRQGQGLNGDFDWLSHKVGSSWTLCRISLPSLTKWGPQFESDSPDYYKASTLRLWWEDYDDAVDQKIAERSSPKPGRTLWKEEDAMG